MIRGVNAACARERKEAIGRMCIPLLPLRHSPADKEPSQQQARGFIPKDQPPRRRGRRLHVALYTGGCCSLVALLSAQLARAYTLARCLSLLSPSLSPSLSLLSSHRLCPSLLLLLFLFSSFFFLSGATLRLVGLLAGWTHWPDSGGFSYWLAGWLTCITGGRQTWCLLFFTRLLLAEMLLAVLVVPAAPRLAPSHSLARTYAR